MHVITQEGKGTMPTPRGFVTDEERKAAANQQRYQYDAEMHALKAGLIKAAEKYGPIIQSILEEHASARPRTRRVGILRRQETILPNVKVSLTRNFPDGFQYVWDNGRGGKIEFGTLRGAQTITVRFRDQYDYSDEIFKAFQMEMADEKGIEYAREINRLIPILPEFDGFESYAFIDMSNLS